ncbi:hypothetical protein, partial [Janthinobacterium sp.]|uniref:hypothetical protein n=1 Tax=Janthinobacterium sp. TaxID=1871054 RepID=UPI002586B808
MRASEVAAAPARTGMPKMLISAPPVAVVLMAMDAFQVVEMKKPAEAGLGWDWSNYATLTMMRARPSSSMAITLPSARKYLSANPMFYSFPNLTIVACDFSTLTEVSVRSY